jgi:hypothetical protein
MRLPYSKVYRAFPELDRFDDARCEAYICTALMTARVNRGVVQIAIFFAGVAVAVLVGIVLANILLLLSAIFDSSDWIIPPFVIIIAGSIAAGGVSGCLLRDVLLRRALRRQIGNSRCPSCNYLLLGLVPKDGSVLCPECGTTHKLTDLGLTEGQLIPVGATG